MTSEEPPISDRTWLRAWLDSEFRNINKRLDQQQIEIGKMRAENKQDHTALNAKFDKLDSKVDTALTKASGLESRADTHDQHHGFNDSAIAARITGVDGRVVVLEGARHDGGVVASVWRAQWKALSGGIAIGGIIVEALHALGVF